MRPWFVLMVSVVTAAVTGAFRFRAHAMTPIPLLDIVFLTACACILVSGLWMLSRRMADLAHEETDRAEQRGE